jgi:hypothetical protein
VKKRQVEFLATVSLAIAALAIRCPLARTAFAQTTSANPTPSENIVNNLSSSDADSVMTSLDSLKLRKDPAGQQQARKLLASSDDYLWFNAALYLAAIKDPQAIPYLVKGLKHPAWRAYPEVLRDLQDLTHQRFDMNQATWIDWWKKQNPTSTFSFTYPRLIQQSAHIKTGDHLLITGVLDPLTVDYDGSSIRLIGLRVKPDAASADAKRLVDIALHGQMVEVTRDGDPPTPDGPVPALLSWEPDPVNAPDMMALMRDNLPPVPFTQKTSIQNYLLESGLYELDLTTIRDPAIRAKLQTLLATTQPAKVSR